MAVCPPEPSLVGHLMLRSLELENSYPVHANAQFDIGRAMIRDWLEIEDRCVSTHHVRIHCVVYEDDDEQKVAPMVWAQVLSCNGALFCRDGIDAEHGGIVVHKEHGAFLLNPGDMLHLSSQISVEYASAKGGKSDTPKLDKIRAAEVSMFSRHFRLSKRVLGIGGYAVVYVADDETTGRQVACKILKQPVSFDFEGRPQLEPNSQDIEWKKKHSVTAREFNVLKRLSHPNIVTLRKVYATDFSVYIFQELITGGDLLSYIERQGPLQEPQAAVIIRQLLEAVQYLHANQVVHRDIKPENILMTSWKDGARIVLTDFGQSRTIEDLEDAARKAGVFRMQSLVGTPGYVAPEILRATTQRLETGSGYSKAVDMWSIGCVTSTILINDFIFPDKRDSSMLKISDAEYNECLGTLDNSAAWDHVGHRAKSFIKGCLRIDEDQRLTASQALAMPWFTHPHYRAEFDAAYRRAVVDWKPHTLDENIIEKLDTKELVTKAFQNAQNVRSTYFPQPTSSKKSTTTSTAKPKTASVHSPAQDLLFASSPDQHTQPPPLPRAPTRLRSEPFPQYEYENDSFSHLTPSDCDKLVANFRSSPQKSRKQVTFGAFDEEEDSLGSIVPAPPGMTQATLR